MIGPQAVKALEDLHRLRGEGVLTDAEFEEAKRSILGNGAMHKSARSGLPPAVAGHIAWITLPLRRYADFKGRSQRKEFWMFQIIYLALFAIAVILVGGTTDSYGEWSPFGNVVAGLIALALIGLFVPLLAAEVRRFHDQDKSGWFVLLNLIPYVGFVIVLIAMLVKGTRGDNRFGPDPTAQ